MRPHDNAHSLVLVTTDGKRWFGKDEAEHSALHAPCGAAAQKVLHFIAAEAREVARNGMGKAGSSRGKGDRGFRGFEPRGKSGSQ